MTESILSLQQFAEIKLVNDAEQPTSLADFVGRRVLIFFFPKADTPGCTTQACGFRDAYPRIQEANAEIIGISADPPKALAKWRAKQSLPYTLLSDPDHHIIEAFGAWGERKMYGRTYMGIIRSHFVFGADGVLEDAKIKVSPEDSITKGVKGLLK